MIVNTKDFAAGLLFIGLGLYFGLTALFGLDIGTAFRMGPGYFPVMLASLLILLGAVVAIKSIGQPNVPIGNAPWRGLVLILIAPILFGTTVRGIGLAPAVALVVLVSAFASRRMGIVAAIAITVGMTAFCIAVFHYGLGLPIRLVGPWIAG